MRPIDWHSIFRSLEGIAKFFTEEEREPEHAEDEAAPIAAGVVFRAPDGQVLLLKRSDKEENYASHWALPGGKADEGESAADACQRECEEEIGVKPTVLKEIDKTPTPNGMVFHTFEASAPDKFIPKLNAEHSEHGWFDPQELPGPLHPGVARVLKSAYGEKASAQDSIALDKSSVRTYDKDGHLHVSRTPISKANVCPYFGREIPDAERLGLDPNKKYRLWRHPDELKKGAETSNGKPLLIKHVPISADDHATDETVGSFGTDAEFDAPYLYNSLAVWPRKAIDGIENDAQREISMGYHYRADMKPGTTPGGEPFDGVMRDIVFNHGALVRDGRAGPDVVVGDSAPDVFDISVFTDEEITLSAFI